MVLALFSLYACGSEPGVGPPDPVDSIPDLREQFGLEALGPIPYPPDNQRSDDRIALGRLLFYDPVLSGERDVACGTCHHPDFDFADGRQFSAGVSGVGLGPGRTLSVSSVSGDSVPVTSRNSPTVLNTALAEDGNGQPSYVSPMFWDGRASGLEEQALDPIRSRVEMRGDAFPGTDEEASAVALDSILARLQAVSEYVDLFRVAFPDESAGGAPAPAFVNASTLARSVAAYQRELVTRNAPFDRFVGGDDNALSAIQKEGLELFFTKAKCFICHRGPMWSNYIFMVTGVPRAGPGRDVIPGDDVGREEHTGRADDRYRFRVPSLRNVELTSPYMHSGVFDSLEDVVRFYNDGANPRHPDITTDMLEVVMREPLGLTDAEISAVAEFLRSLTDPGTALAPELRTVPASVPSGLTPVFGRR